LRPVFAARVAHQVSGAGADVHGYDAARLDAEAAPATPNRKLAALRRAVRGGHEDDRSQDRERVPPVRIVSEADLHEAATKLAALDGGSGATAVPATVPAPRAQFRAQSALPLRKGVS